ncbi:hypothetical protein HZS_1000, partial [Henneguya salminicola]
MTKEDFFGPISFFSPINSKEIKFEHQENITGETYSLLIASFLKFTADVFPCFNQLYLKYVNEEEKIKLSELALISSEFNEISRTQQTPVETYGFKYKRIASKPLLQYIISLSYTKCIKYPKHLNRYQAFSSMVYGEVSFECLDLIFAQLELADGVAFLDLGSGVGQVVMQVAGTFHCKSCIGIEISDIPYNYSLELSAEFKNNMDFFGYFYSDFDLLYGDFISNVYTEHIVNSNLIFANNYMFGSELNHLLQLKFRELKDDLGAIVRITALNFKLPNMVSWTNKDIPFYLHTIDNQILISFLVDNQKRFGDMTKIEPLSSSSLKRRCTVNSSKSKKRSSMPSLKLNGGRPKKKCRPKNSLDQMSEIKNSPQHLSNGSLLSDVANQNGILEKIPPPIPIILTKTIEESENLGTHTPSSAILATNMRVLPPLSKKSQSKKYENTTLAPEHSLHSLPVLNISPKFSRIEVLKIINLKENIPAIAPCNLLIAASIANQLSPKKSQTSISNPMKELISQSTRFMPILVPDTSNPVSQPLNPTQENISTITYSNLSSPASITRQRSQKNIQTQISNPRKKITSKPTTLSPISFPGMLNLKHPKTTQENLALTSFSLESISTSFAPQVSPKNSETQIPYYMKEIISKSTPLSPISLPNASTFSPELHESIQENIIYMAPTNSSDPSITKRLSPKNVETRISDSIEESLSQPAPFSPVPLLNPSYNSPQLHKKTQNSIQPTFSYTSGSLLNTTATHQSVNKISEPFNPDKNISMSFPIVSSSQPTERESLINLITYKKDEIGPQPFQRSTFPPPNAPSLQNYDPVQRVTTTDRAYTLEVPFHANKNCPTTVPCSLHLPQYNTFQTPPQIQIFGNDSGNNCPIISGSSINIQLMPIFDQSIFKPSTVDQSSLIKAKMENMLQHFDKVDIVLTFQAYASLISINEIISNNGITSYSSLSSVTGRLYRQIRDNMDTYKEVVNAVIPTHINTFQNKSQEAPQ